MVPLGILSGSEGQTESLDANMGKERSMHPKQLGLTHIVPCRRRYGATAGALCTPCGVDRERAIVGPPTPT